MLTKRKNFYVNLRKQEEVEINVNKFSRQAMLDGYEHVSNGGHLFTDAELLEKYGALFKVDAFKEGYFSNYQGYVVQGIRKVQKIQRDALIHRLGFTEEAKTVSIPEPHFKIENESAFGDMQHVPKVEIEDSLDLDSLFFSPANLLITFDAADECDSSDLRALNKKAFTSFEEIFVEEHPNKKRP